VKYKRLTNNGDAAYKLQGDPKHTKHASN